MKKLTSKGRIALRAGRAKARRCFEGYARMKVPLVTALLGVSLSVNSAIVPGGEITQIRKCGKEDRDASGQLQPFAVSIPFMLNMSCRDCEIKFTFDVSNTAGHPIVKDVKYRGMSDDQAVKLSNNFRSQVFPHCLLGEGTRGFLNEVRVYSN